MTAVPSRFRLMPQGPVPHTAMVLAAGLGQRMRPLTQTRPKPLIRVGGRPLIDWVFEHLADAGVEKAVVNVHYLADQLEAHLKRAETQVQVIVSDEREQLLETGGGVAKALPLIDADPFYVINADNLWVDGAANALRQLASQWDDRTMDALLLLVPYARAEGYEGAGDFHMDQMGRLRRRVERRLAPHVFSGIQILSKRLFTDLPEGPFSLNLLYDRAIEAGRLFGAQHAGLWYHVGTAAAIEETEAALARA